MSLKQYSISNIFDIDTPKESNDSISSSKIEIKWLQMVEKEMNIKIQYKTKTTPQYKIKAPGKGYYKVDGFNADLNIVFEFHGDLFHGHCGKYKNDTLLNNTLEREQYILSKGYRLFRIFECEFKAHLKGTNPSLGVFVH